MSHKCLGEALVYAELCVKDVAVKRPFSVRKLGEEMVSG